jgi:hypothetical protein
MHLIIADVIEPELFRGAVEVAGKICHCVQVRSFCILSVITTLEFIGHHLT